MHLRRFRLAQFAHVAHHKNARCRLLGQHVQRGLHAVGVGVVGIVQNQGVAYAVLLLQPPFNVAERRQSGCNFRQRHARLHRQSRRSAGIGHVVPPCRRQRHAHALRAIHQIKRTGQRLQIDVFGVNIALLRAKGERFQTIAGCLKHGQVRVFGRQQGNAVFR